MKKIIINTIIIFIISVLIHSFYNLLPNFLTSIFFPVNESIWEHMKMIFTSYMLFILLKFAFNKLDKNDLFATVTSAIFNIIIFLIIYIPIYNLFGEHLVVTLIIYFITILISNFLWVKLTKKEINKKFHKLFFIPIIIVYIIFTYLTYYPIKAEIFYDKPNEKYGVYNKYS